MKVKILISFMMLFGCAFGQSNCLFQRWHDKTYDLLLVQAFEHESIQSDSIINLFDVLIRKRDQENINIIDTTKIDVIIIVEIFDFCTNNIQRLERFIDWGHSDETYFFDSNFKPRIYRPKNGAFTVLNEEWKYKNVIKASLPPRNYGFWTGSCIAGSPADEKKAKKMEAKINKNQSYIENYLKIVTYINNKTNQMEITFFTPVRGKRCVIPHAGICGRGKPYELVLDGYFENN